MTESRPDPKVVLQAHALRTAAARDALMHGTESPRTRRTVLGALAGSAVLAVVILVAVIVISRIVTVLHHSGH